jgi:trehalose synthase
MGDHQASLGQDGQMAEPRDIEVTAIDPQRLSHVIGTSRLNILVRAAEQTRTALGGGRVWNVSATSAGGGVAEMLHILVGYSLGCGVDTRWVVIDGDETFFRITKRLHNRLHGAAGDTGGLGRSEADHYAAVMDENAAALINRVNEEDVVVLHDPQTVGLAEPLTKRGARVVWRCHIGTERSNAHTEEGWNFLQGYLKLCCAYVFSHAGFVPRFLSGADVAIIAPSIDPHTAKNRRLNGAQVHKLLVRIGLFDDGSASVGSLGAVLGGAGPLSTDDRVVVQVSRWDHLKDMGGVLEGFAGKSTRQGDVRLALVGPAVDAVSDDPEGAKVLDECLTCWENLSSRQRSAVRLITLPMDDFELNALMVNAIQRHATVVVQKSLEEGFGLTVAEAMWKSRPVVASAIGGIVDQVAPGTGILLSDPSDLDTFAKTLDDLLVQPEKMAALGRRARERIRSDFLTDRHLADYARLIEHVTRL